MDEETGAIVPRESGVAPAAGAVQELAAEAAKVMDRIAEHLKLETPHPSTARRVRGARTVPRGFVLSMIAAAELRPDFPFLGELDTAAAREMLEAADAYRQLAERTAMFLASLNYTIEAGWARLVEQAMEKFTLASILAESPEYPELAAEIKNLRAQLGRKGLRKKKAAKKRGKSRE